MIYEEMLAPKYRAETDNRVHLYSSAFVSKELYDLFWKNFVSFMSGMHFGHSYTADQFLSNSDMPDLLNEDGIKAAEKCLEHIANAELLPIVIDGKCGDFTCFN